MLPSLRLPPIPWLLLFAIVLCTIFAGVSVPMFQKNIAEGTDCAPVQLALAAPARVAPPPLPPQPALSTFSVNVGRAGYARVREALMQGARPDGASLRVEEIVNAGRYADPLPRPPEVLALAGEAGPCPWAPEHRLVRLALRARGRGEERRQPVNLVLLLDVSGSMAEPDRLPLVKKALARLVEQLGADDRLAVVTYAGDSRVALEPTPGSQRERILDAIRGLEANGSTNGSAGIQTAYRLARESFRAQMTNRVVLATDGDLNVGITSEEELGELITREAAGGIWLTVLGVGPSSAGDAVMDTLAYRGNGVYAHLDSVEEAERVLVSQLDGALFTVARDVKIQVAFDPAQVLESRLIGFAKRELAHADFANDAKDAGEIGAGHAVTALYELRLAPDASRRDLAEFRVRYQPPQGGRSTLRAITVSDPGRALSATSPAFRLAAALAWFGEQLATDSRTPDAARAIGALVADVARTDPLQLPPDLQAMLARW